MQLTADNEKSGQNVTIDFSNSSPEFFDLTTLAATEEVATSSKSCHT